MAFAEISLSKAVNCVAKVHETFWLFGREIRFLTAKFAVSRGEFTSISV
jgi:hypothetical protein